MRARRRELTLEKQHPDYVNKHVVEQRGGTTISHEINLNRDPRAMMQEYIKLIEAHSD